MFRYAQIDENGRVFTTSEHSAELKHERAIPIPPGFDPWGKRWNGADWEDCELNNDVTFEHTQLDRIEQAINLSNIALSQTYSEIENKIIDNYTMDLVENNII